MTSHSIQGQSNERNSVRTHAGMAKKQPSPKPYLAQAQTTFPKAAGPYTQCLDKAAQRVQLPTPPKQLGKFKGTPQQALQGGLGGYKPVTHLSWR